MKNQNEERNNEEKSNETNLSWLIFNVGLSLIGVGVVWAYSHYQMTKSVKMLSKAADSVADLTVVDIRDNIIDQAIENAANRQVGQAVAKAARAVENEMIAETQKRVRSAVQQNYGKLQKVVSESIAREAAKVDQSAIMEEATERAKEMLLERFDGKLDGLMTDYQRNLDNVGKIYQSIASSMADKAGKDITLKVG